MKKALLASTAIVAAAAIASPANAADKITLSLGGYMEQYIGFADNETDQGGTRATNRDFATFDQQNDQEIYFSGNTTLDNGIKIGVRVELEADAGAAGNIDEAWLDIQTQWGSIRLGEEDAMADLQAVEVSRGISGDHDNWVPRTGINRAMGDDTYSVGNSGDDNQIHYLSPSLAGFQVGVSYTPEVGANGESQPNRIAISTGGTGSGVSSGYSATLNWSGSFGDVGIDTAYAYYKEGGDSTTLSEKVVGHHVGLNLSFGGLGVGGSYGRQMGSDSVSAADDGYAYKAGIWYSTGPMTFGYYHHTSMTEQAAGGDDEQNVNSVWFNYNVSDGVRWESMVFNTDYDSPGSADNTFTDGGWGVVSGLRLSF